MIFWYHEILVIFCSQLGMNSSCSIKQVVVRKYGYLPIFLDIKILLKTNSELIVLWVPILSDGTIFKSSLSTNYDILPYCPKSRDSVYF